jgi:hypothetical protein
LKLSKKVVFEYATRWSFLLSVLLLLLLVVLATAVGRSCRYQLFLPLLVIFLRRRPLSPFVRQSSLLLSMDQMAMERLFDSSQILYLSLKHLNCHVLLGDHLALAVNDIL